MASEREVRLLLEHARLPEPEAAEGGKGDTDGLVGRVPARDVYARVLLLGQQTAVPGLDGGLSAGELLARTAEAAIHQGDFATALESASRFFCECSARNQFYCRALLARAQCESHGARLETGPSKLRRLLNAIHFVAQVLPIATEARKRPVYGFLVYNASVIYWQIARQLMKQSTFQFLVPSLTAIIDALKLVKEEDALWVARLQMALVHALVDAGQLPSAAKAVNEVVDAGLAPLMGNPAWGSNIELRTIYEEALCLQIHVGSLKDAECQKIVPAVRKTVQSSPIAKRLTMLVKLQCLKSGNLQGTPEEVHDDIFRTATGMGNFSAATTPEVDVRGFVAALDSAALGAIDAEILIETAIHATLSGFLRFASYCDMVVELKRKSMQPRHRLLHQVLKVLLQTASNAANHEQQRLSEQQRQQAMLLHHVEGVKALERTLLAVKRLGDQNLAERVCMLTWNLARPLLQPHLRVQVERAFNLASTTLEEQESLLLEFRARLYLEVAKLDAASDFVVKANANAGKALGLDYGTITPPSAQSVSIDALCSHAGEWTSRPVDLQLEWIKRTTQAKLAPESTREPGDSIFAMLEQVKESKDKQHQRQLLVRCRDALNRLEQLDSGAIAIDAVLLMMLWSEVATAAWRALGDSELARNVIAHTLGTYFPNDSQDTPLLLSRRCNVKAAMMYEIELRLLLVEVVGEDMKVLRDHVDQAERSLARDNSAHDNDFEEIPTTEQNADSEDKLDREMFIFGIQHITASKAAGTESEGDSAPVEDRTLGENDAAKLAMDLKLELLRNLSASIAAATRIGWAPVLENTCVYLWNYHFHVFLMLLEEQKGTGSGDSEFCHQRILPECVDAFEAAFAALEMNETEVNSDLLSCLALGLCTLYEKSGRWDKAVAMADSVSKRSTRDPMIEGESGRTFNVLQLKQFAELKARAQVAQSTKDVSFPDGWPPVLKIVGFLEAMETLSQPPEGSSTRANTVPDKAAAAHYEKAVTLWQTTVPEILAELEDPKSSWSLEECRQHAELLTEVWVRIGFGALRLRYPRYAIECAEQALLPASKGDEINSSWKELIVTGTNAWFALAELMYSASILSLVHGHIVPQKLMCAASSRLAQAGRYAMIAGTRSLIVKACEVLWNGFIKSDLADPDAEIESEDGMDGDYLDYLLKHLCVLLGLLQQTPRTVSHTVAFYGDMIVLALDICERKGDWKRAFQVSSDALSILRQDSSNLALPTEVQQQIQTTYAIAAINIGKSALSSSGGGARQRDDSDPVLQAQILKQIAVASSKDPPTQLKLLTAAHSELQGLKAEQALALMDVAEWLLSNCLPISDVHAYLDSAMAMLISSEQKELEWTTSAQSRRSGTSRHLTTTATPTTGSKSDHVVHPPLWHFESLLRVFVTKAEISRDFTQRIRVVTFALHQVERAWGILISLANELSLQTSFSQAKASGGAAMAGVEYDTWKLTAALKFSPPHSSSEWISFHLQHEKSVESRFYMPWVQALQPLLTSGSKVILDAGLTLHHLESLLTMLQRDCRFELMLPVVCLYQVLLFAAVPRRGSLTVVWIDLVLFVTMEQLQMNAGLSIPLQSALAVLNSQGDKFAQELKESLSALYRRQSTTDGSTVKLRGLLPHSSTDSVSNALSTIALLLDTGFVRQAKGLLDVVLSLANSMRLDGVQEIISRCQMLASRILEIEGKRAAAIARVEVAMAGSAPLQLVRYLDWALHKCKWSATTKEKLRILDMASARGANILASYIEAEQQHSSAYSSKVSLLAGDKSAGGSVTRTSLSSLDAVVAIARVKFKQATVWLKQASSAAHEIDHDTTAIVRALEASKTAFEDSRRLLQSVAALDISGKITLQYATRLNRLYGVDESGRALVDKTQIRQLVNTAIELIERGAERLEWKLWRPAKTSTQEDSVSATPWEIDVAAARLCAAGVEIDLESSSNMVQAHEMTWYECVENSHRTVVEKWLAKTDARMARPEGGNLAYAMALVAGASSIVERSAGATELRARAQLQGIQCRRLSICHGENRRQSDTFQQLLWAKFGGSSATESRDQEEPWICVHSGLEGSVAAEEGGREDSEELAGIAKFVDSASTTLLACQRSALELRSVDLVRQIAYELVQVLGCRRPFESAMQLLLYQSCMACTHMESLLQLCLDPSSVLSLHLRRMKRLSKFHSSARSASLPFQLSQLYMDQQSDAFKRMSLGTTPVDALIASLPPSYRILCLQFSPEKCFLYAALVPVSGDKRCTMARMEFTSDQAVVLEDLLKRLEVWRASMAKTLVSLEEEHGCDEAFEFVPVSMALVSSLSSEQDALEKEISAVIRETTELLRPLFAHVRLQTELKNELAGNSLMMLVDRALAGLPLEALPFFDGAESIARDFSIHMLHHRVSAVKTQPVRRDEVRTIVDPHKDDSGGAGGQTMDSAVRQLCKVPGASLQWKDAVEHGQIPSATDWQHALVARRGGSLLYVGPNRVVGSSLSLCQLAGLNVAVSCHALLLLDQAESVVSLRRQSKCDNEKAAWELQVEEDPFLRALLLSLVGVNALVLNQWATTPGGNRRLATGLLQGLAKGQSLGRALRAYADATVSIAAGLQPSGSSATISSNSSSSSSLPPGSGPPSQTSSASALVPAESASASASASARAGGKMRLKNRLRFNTVAYGLAHLGLKAGE